MLQIKYDFTFIYISYYIILVHILIYDSSKVLIQLQFLSIFNVTRSPRVHVTLHKIYLLHLFNYSFMRGLDFPNASYLRFPLENEMTPARV